ncbi:hypothetical protein WME95_37925 [Sorangium sp. So ce327]
MPSVSRCNEGTPRASSSLGCVSAWTAALATGLFVLAGGEIRALFR